ncbi:MAG TPA: DUF1631 family protein [Burkholderiaceae bacterium]|nr:DUF1631 family protein [Burkholderiaceae bacterium]
MHASSTSGHYGDVPYLPAGQASALLRSAAAIASELIGTAFPSLVTIVNEQLTARWDFGVGSPLVQRILATKEEELRAAYLERLKTSQDEALSRLVAVKSGTPTLKLDAESLSLVDEAESAGETIADRCARRMGGMVEEPMRDLNVIVGYLTGRGQLASADNPFGPSVFVPPLLRAAEDVNLHPEAWEFFLSAFERPFGEELVRVQFALIDHFRVHGIESKAIRRGMTGRAVGSSAGRKGIGPDVEPATDASGGGGAGGGGAPGADGAGQGGGGGGAIAGDAAMGNVAGGAPGARGAAGGPAGARGGGGGASSQVLLDALLARLQANARGLDMPPMPAAIGPVPPALIESVNELQQLGLEGLQGAAFAGGSAGSVNAWREHLISQSTRTVDKLTIELVGMMFDQVMRDNHVPSEIKALLSRLQFPVLKAALLDAAFFASSSHPARRLIDRLASTSVGWEPYGDENEKFLAEVDRVVRDVLVKFDKDVAVFEKLLAEFESFVSEIKPRDADPVARAKRALEDAERREILTINTTIQVRRAFERVDLEPFMRDFLVGPWVKVLVTASQRDDETKGFSKSFREVIHDLVWSVQPKATADERRRLVELIPPMTRILRDGMALIRMPEREQSDYLNELMAAHAMAVKPTDQATYIRHSLQSSELRARIDGLQMTGSFPMTTVPGGVRVSTGALMQVAAEHNADLTVPDPLTDVTVSSDVDRAEDAKLDAEIASWARGTWFELWNGAEFIKARLRWVSPLRTLFMFSGGVDNKAHVMSPELIKGYLRRKFIRPLESTPLTRRAVDAVVAEFEKTPGRAKELAARYADAAAQAQAQGAAGA